MAKKKIKKRLTIERQLERYCKEDTYADRNEVLWHAWCQNKRWFSQLLETTLGSFPTYSRHDESHAQTVLHNIEMILGEDRISKLSASDCFMILHTVYIHDIGMVITYSDRKEIVNNDNFLEMVEELGADNDTVFRKAVEALEKTDYSYEDEIGRSEQKKRLYEDKLEVYYSILHLIANFRRSEHGTISDKRLQEWTLESEKLGAGFSMAGIPQRIFILIAQCAGLHTDSDFEHIMLLPQEDNGYVSDYLHPRFIAVLLQLGDILDMDNDRFHPLTKECMGDLPEISERHFQKHQAIRKLYIRPDIISIEADCSSQDALRLVRKECDMLKEILKNASYNWMLICPPYLNGALPALDSVTLYLNGTKIPEELVATQFCISQKKAFAILEGSNVYEDQFVFLREFLQNAIDASKMQYWHECIRTKGYYTSEDELRKKSPDEFEKMLSTDLFPIEIKMQMVMRDENQNEKPVTEEEIESLKDGRKQNWEYGVKVMIKDFGTGMDKDCILNIAKVGDSRKRERRIINKMPQWLMPTAEFGIGLQSAFILTNMFKCYTYTRSNEKYEITFSTVKSNYYEGYINVQPLDEVETFGTCFEVFVPISKKLSHEIYPSAWNGKDYFDDDYEVLRPIRHSAELLAQMVLYLDSQIGEQIFPIHLRVDQVNGIEIPLNKTDKNKLRRLSYSNSDRKYDDEEDKKFYELLKTDESDIGVKDKLCKTRDWNKYEKSWIYYLADKEQLDILTVKTNYASAIIDCRNGHLYLWDNNICAFCTINMENFLQMEKRQIENIEKVCENIQKNVHIYYKGISLEEMELPDIGNELIQYIDIKGKLNREYINLNRKGFTESGRLYFLDNIYHPLLGTIHNTLKQFNKEYNIKLQRSIISPLIYKRKIVRKIDSKLYGQNKLDDFLELEYYAKMRKEIATQLIRQRLEEIRNDTIVKIKEQTISVAMLAFLARRETENSLYKLGCGSNDATTKCYWKKVIRCICGQGKWMRQQKEISSLLFHISTYIPADLLQPDMYLRKKECSFIDIISADNLYMIISNRKHKSAPWEQFLIPIQNGDRSLIDTIENYLIADNMTKEKRKFAEELKDIERNSFRLANYFINDEVGKSRMIGTKEYRQQYIIKWLLRYIPTIALFMSRDGDTRINIISSKRLPIMYVNDNYKMHTLQRIMEDRRKYHIERFAIPAWQGLQYLCCERLPYAHYFVKRGYMSKNSYCKTIFPFGEKELYDISTRINSNTIGDKLINILSMYRILNVSTYVLQNLNSENDHLLKCLNNMFSDSQSVKEGWIKKYTEFKRECVRNKYETLPDVLDKFNSEYISFIRFRYRMSYHTNTKFNLDNLGEYKYGWDRICVCILLKIVGHGIEDEANYYLRTNLESEGNSLVSAWLYLINGEYIIDSSEVAIYSNKFMSELDNDNSNIFRKQKRIVEFIQSRNGKNYSINQLWNCWKVYLQEIFQMFCRLECMKIDSPEVALDDYTLIKKILQEETNDRKY